VPSSPTSNASASSQRFIMRGSACYHPDPSFGFPVCSSPRDSHLLFQDRRSRSRPVDRNRISSFHGHLLLGLQTGQTYSPAVHLRVSSPCLANDDLSLHLYPILHRGVGSPLGRRRTPTRLPRRRFLLPLNRRLREVRRKHNLPHPGIILLESLWCRTRRRATMLDLLMILRLVRHDRCRRALTRR